MPRFTKKRVGVGIAATAVAMVVAGGTAYAYWTTTGSGTGSATNAPSNGTLVLHASFAGGLTPGAQQTVTYTADNTGTSSLQIGAITSVVTIDSGHSGCSASDFVVPATIGTTTVPKTTNGASAGTTTITFTDTGSNQDACKGAIVTLTASA